MRNLADPKSLEAETTMTGRHAAFLITRAAKRYIMQKKMKENLLSRLGQFKPKTIAETTELKLEK